MKFSTLLFIYFSYHPWYLKTLVNAHNMLREYALTFHSNCSSPPHTPPLLLYLFLFSHRFIPIHVLSLALAYIYSFPFSHSIPISFLIFYFLFTNFLISFLFSFLHFLPLLILIIYNIFLFSIFRTSSRI